MQNGNHSELTFWVKRKEVRAPKEKAFNYFLPYHEENKIQNQSLDLYFPKRTLYENVYLKYHASNEKSSGVYSSVHHIHNYKTPVHRYFNIGIRPGNLPDSLRSKAFIAYCRKDGKMENCGGKWKGDKLTTKVRSFGDYCIMVDQTPPRIVPIQFKSYMKGASKMTFKITDNIETARNVEYLDYRATVDGKWILMQYDSKKDLLIHRFDGSLAPGKHTLRLEVKDSRGNKKILERQFTI